MAQALSQLQLLSIAFCILNDDPALKFVIGTLDLYSRDY